MNQRECRQCKETKDLTPANFFVDSVRGKEGYRVTCKSCELMRRKELYEGDKSAHADRMKRYREANKDRITEQRKQYREANHDKIKEQQEAEKERRKETITCECGATIRKDSKKRHLKTTQHENYIRQKA